MKKFLSIVLIILVFVNLLPAQENVVVSLTSVPEGAKVYFNGEEKGTTPFIGKVDAGVYTIELKMKGYQTYKMDDVEVVPGKELIVTDIELKEAIAAPWYKKWWVWTGIILIGAGAGAAAAMGGGSDGGSDTIPTLPTPPQPPSGK